MACMPCWQNRQLLMEAMRRGNPVMATRAAIQGVHIATDKYVRGIDVTKKYAAPLTRSTVPVWRRGGNA